MLAIGDLFADRYRLLEEKETGGTAVVYLAFDQQESQNVALKIFKSGALPPAILTEMWNREYAALSKIKHENIVRIMDAGRSESDDLKYLVLEWFNGRSLDEELKTQPAMPFDRFMSLYGNLILDALCHAAGIGIIHRDLSPRNILVNQRGELKIIDFGQAKVGAFNLGLTVAGYATPPYCPPEPDTGKHTSTRDAFSFCALVIRALCGKVLKNHDDLYDELEVIKTDAKTGHALEAALARDPLRRPPGILEFSKALQGDIDGLPNLEKFDLFIRITPEADQSLAAIAVESETARSALIDELNEAVSISKPREDESEYRFVIQTRSFRCYADLDRMTECSIAIFRAHKIINAAGFWWAYGWQPEMQFVEKIPTTNNEKTVARKQVAAFYAAYAEFLSTNEYAGANKSVKTFDMWTRMLDAMAEIERTKIPALNYSKPSVEQNRLTVELETSEGAEIGQQRIISLQRKQVFAGQIELIRGTACTLVSKWSVVKEDSLPRNGTLEVDWNLARVAIQRQRHALDKFSNGTVVNNKLADYVTLKELGAEFPTYYRNQRFFDESLDDDKKVIVSRFAGMRDILLIHGPPGTGKTTLIVELIRQYLANDKSHRILLVAQTHVAIDHALTGVLSHDPELKIVRIDSGMRQLSENIKPYSMENRNRSLKARVEEKTELFLQTRAKALGVNFDDVRLGMLATEVLKARQVEMGTQLDIVRLEEEVSQLRADLENRGYSGLTTTNVDAVQSRIRSLDDSLFEMSSLQEQARAERKYAESKLERFGEDGKSLSLQDSAGLEEWCDALLRGSNASHLKDLIQTIEEWKLKLGQSDDFKTAVIADSQIVSGTCVGFCRENAAANSEYDLCIVDEASKATTTELIVPMAQARHVLLIGDHHQLPPVIDYALHNAEVREEYSLDEGQLGSQLFELLQKTLRDGQKANLTTQFRMRASIGDLISHCFYEGELKNHPDCKNRKTADLTFAELGEAITWFDTSIAAGRGERRFGTSYYNPTEADCVIALLKRIVLAAKGQKLKRPLNIGIISGYAEQARYIQGEISREKVLSGFNIECSTVHQFQGREVDVCIYSITRDNKGGEIGFLEDWRHLNVALSRARDFLIIVGSRSFCKSITAGNPFHNVMNYIEANHPHRFIEWRNADN